MMSNKTKEKLKDTADKKTRNKQMSNRADHFRRDKPNNKNLRNHN
jgi:hypothetical protein